MCANDAANKKLDRVPGEKEKEVKNQNLSRRNCCNVCAIGFSLLFGFMFLTIGLLTTYFPLYEFVINESLEMKPYYLNFQLWQKPEPEVLLKVHVFNITNADDFIKGRTNKLRISEVGPIVFRETLEHDDIEYHRENSTMSYTVSRRLVYKESANIEGILNQTVYVMNMAVGGASYVSDNYYLRKSYSVMLRTMKTEPIVKTTIYNYFFNLTDPVLELAHNIVPFLVPTKDTGMLQNIYKNFTDRVNVNIGRKHGPKKFFTINTWNGRPTVPRFYPERGECNASLYGSSEGAIFENQITKDTVLWYWRKTMCRITPLYFDKEVTQNSLKAYRFTLKSNAYDRFENSTADCYKGDNLPNGLSDLSKCFFDQPIVASMPHFYNTPGSWDNYLEGLQPNGTIHQSYSIVEPILGVPLTEKASSQCNLYLKDLTGFKSDFARFSNKVIPMLWLEYYLGEVSPTIISSTYFVVNTLPKIQYWISAGLIIFGLGLLMIGYSRLRGNEEIVEKIEK